MDHEMNELFFPKTLAVIGASKNPVGAVKYVKAHLDTGMEIFPVNKNPKLEELEGLKVYRSVTEIDRVIDLAIIGVPKEHVPGVIKELNGKVKYAVIFTSGFKESGNEALDEELAEAIEGSSTRFIGPNCLGVYHPKAGLMYFPQMRAGPEWAGNVAYISQSGGHTAKATTMLISRGAFFSKVVSIGNAMDITPAELITYFKEDDDTSVIGLYLESARDGRELMGALADTAPAKPVVIWKGGHGEVGFRATASHTGELAGNHLVWKAMAKQTGTILVEDFDTFCDVLVAFSFAIPPPASLKVALIACGGGNAVEAGDFFEKIGFEIPELSEETQKKVLEFIPDVNTSLTNPVDLGEYGYVPDYFAKAVEIIASDPQVDCVVYIKESQRFPLFSVNFLMEADEYEKKMVASLAKAHERVAATRNVPLFCNDPFLEETVEGASSRVSFRDALAKKKIPVFPRIDILAGAIKAMHEYHVFKQARR